MIGRFFNVTGPRQSPSYGMVVPRFVDAALDGRPLLVYGTGQQTRTFLYVADLVRAILFLIARPEAEGQVFNIGGVEEVRILDLARRVVERTGSRSAIEMVDPGSVYGTGFEETARRVPDNAKLEGLGFRPEYTLDAILDATIEHRRGLRAG